MRRRRFASRSFNAGRLTHWEIDPDVMKGIWGVFCFAVAFFLLISFVGHGGAAGDTMVGILNWLLGAGEYVVPVVFGAIALIFFTSFRRNLYASAIVGSVLFFSGFLGLLTLTDPSHIRGGAWGLVVVWPLLQIMSPWAVGIVLAALFGISLLIAFNISPAKLFHRNKEEALALQKQEVEAPAMNVKTFGEATPIEQNKQKENTRPQKEENPKEKQEKDAGKEFVVTRGAMHKSDFHLPPVDLLEPETGKPNSGDIVARANSIKRTLSNFGIEVEMGEVNVGPTVTQFTLKPAEGIKLSRITALHDDLALALAAHPLRIEAPIPGRALVGIEVPNRGIATVRLRNLLDNEELRHAPSTLMLAVGRDVSGAPTYANLSKMPHLLIAGSTGSGKTIALNSLILSLLYQNPPELLRLILVDPKRVEFPVYGDIPHLLSPVVIDNHKAVNALRWTVSEMERRFDVLSKAHARDIQSYNGDKKVVEEDGPMPYIVVVIDELADLMTSKGKEAEALIVRLAQMSRAVGIHLVLATQRPSVEVITGLIKANITARMAFQVASQIDSRTILDMGGAEKLLGAGDMLYLAPESSKPRRIQGAFVSDKEIKRITDFLRDEAKRVGENVQQEEFSHAPGGEEHVSGKFMDFDSAGGAEGDDDELYEEARRVVISAGRASASLLQRRLRVGYARAARLIDMMEERGVVGPGEGAKPREVYESVAEEEGEI